VTTSIAVEGGEIPHVSGAGELKLYDPLPAELQQQAPPPAPQEENQPERKTRFPTT
ncbi:MAG: hypothetical protein IT368_04120, partial [Candidatus Hydrogenedentes bacterium]|nr:hypothetical protein [Candidatus Hydrogenedentota bacterium]